MGIAERKVRERTERKRHIVETARTIAEAEGWGAVTIRRLAQEIEFSQPVLYSHFQNRDAIVAAVALDGFRAFAEAMREAIQAGEPGEAALRVALAYLAFARQRPAVYAAMFSLPTELHFAKADTMPELHEAFASLTAVVPSDRDTETVTETFWATLHGLAELDRNGRVRPDARMERVTLAVRRLTRSN
jgi:AcrR family transcriptional regulator